MSIEAMKLALEALDGIHPDNMTTMAEETWGKAIETLRAAIEQAEEQRPHYTWQYAKDYIASQQAEKQEPVAWQCQEHGETEWFNCSKEAHELNPRRYIYRALYTAPPQHLLDEAREEGRKQERALWEMAKIGQEIEQEPITLDGLAKHYAQTLTNLPMAKVVGEHGEVDWISFVPSAGAMLYIAPPHFLDPAKVARLLDEAFQRGKKEAVSEQALDIVQKLVDSALLNSAPPQREWQGLTSEEFAEILCDDRWQNRPELMLLQAQDKLKEKNT